MGNVFIKSVVEYIFVVTLMFNAFVFIPQAIKLFKIKNSKELSLITFVGFIVMQIFTVLHGYLTKDYVLMFGFLLSLITCGVATFLIVYYRFSARRE